MSTFQFVVREASDLGAAVAEARAVAGRTQADLAGRIGVDRTYVARLENGHTTEQLERLFALFAELGVRVTATIPDPGATGG